MTLEVAIKWAERHYELWTKFEGKPVVHYIWHVVKWNNEYIVIDDNVLRKHPDQWKTVYNTKEKILYDNNKIN